MGRTMPAQIGTNDTGKLTTGPGGSVPKRPEKFDASGGPNNPRLPPTSRATCARSRARRAVPRPSAHNGGRLLRPAPTVGQRRSRLAVRHAGVFVSMGRRLEIPACFTTSAPATRIVTLWKAVSDQQARTGGNQVSTVPARRVDTHLALGVIYILW